MTDNSTDRYKNRRRMAWYSFYCFSVFGTILISLGLVSEDIRIALQALWPQTLFIMGLWASIVAGYFRVTYGTDLLELKND